MDNKERLMVYPFDSQASPILRHERLMDNYEIVSVISPNGWGFCDRDAGYVDSGNDIGIDVCSSFDELIDSVDTVLFMESFKKLDIQKLVLPKIQKVAEKGKNIICTLNLEEVFYKEVEKICKDKGSYIKYYNPLRQVRINTDTYESVNSIYDIKTPVVFVLGVAEKVHKFEIQLSLRNYLIESGYKVSQVGSRHYCEMFGFHSFPSFMYSEGITETKKIKLFNNFIKQIETEEHPDVIIIGIPGGLMPFNKHFSNNFGIFAYEVSQAVFPDVAIFSTLYENYTPEYFEKILLSVRYRLGYDVDIFNLSNNKFDWKKSTFLKNMEYITINSGFIDEKKQNLSTVGKPVYNILNNTDAVQLANKVVNILSSNCNVITT